MALPTGVQLTTLNTWLTGAYNFATTYTRNTKPFLFSALNVNKLSFGEQLTAEEIPDECGSAFAQAKSAIAALQAYQATNNAIWLTRGLLYLESLITYFFVSDVPNPVNSANLWASHWLINADTTSLTSKGSQSSADPFNYGYFEVDVVFTSGLGVISAGTPNNGELLANVYRVHTGELLYQNVNAPLISTGNLVVDYWVSDYKLLGTNYRITPTLTKTSTSDTPGTIKLTSSFSGTAKVVYSCWDGASIAPYEKVEIYPMWHKPTTVNMSFRAMFAAYEAFSLALTLTSNVRWQRAALSVANTINSTIGISNESFYYKESADTILFTRPGSKLVQTSNSNGYTATRENSGDLINYLKVVVGADTNPTIQLQNSVVITNVSSAVVISAKVAITVSTILEVILNDGINNYIAPWLIIGDSASHTKNFNYLNFLRWTTGTNWHSTINLAPLTTYGATDVGESVVLSVEQDTALLRVITFTVATTTGGVTLNNGIYLTTPPNVTYSSNALITIRVQDSDGDYWYSSLPSTSGALTTTALSWSSFTNLISKPSPGSGNILNVSFESNTNAVLKLYYLGANPLVIPLNSTVVLAAIRSNVAAAHTIWFGDFKANSNPNNTLNYSPAIVPFSAITSGNTVLSAGLFPQVQNQSAYYWRVVGVNSYADTVINFIDLSQLSYTAQSPTALNTLLTPNYFWLYWSTAFFKAYGVINNFSFNSPLVSSRSATNHYYVFEDLAKYLLLNPSDAKVKKLLINYLEWVKLNLANSSNLPTEILPGVTPTVLGHNPVNIALALKTAIYANASGLSSVATIDIIQRCYTYLTSEYVGTGLMAGSFSANQSTFVVSGTTYRQYGALMHSEIVSAITELINYKDKLFFVNVSLLNQAGVFPNISPSRIESITLPPFKANKVKFDDGSTQRTLLSQGGVKTELVLGYEDLSDEQAKTFIDFWRLSQGQRIPFTLPSTIINHPTVIIAALSAQGSTTYWRFADAFDLDTEFATNLRGIRKANIKIVSVIN